jgi:4-amino-4-deoxy-L-arabinose transferase-like glycosyltransferase
MDARRLGRWLVGGLLIALLAEAAWLRVAALGPSPEVNGDEAFFGIVAHRLVSGGRVPMRTYSGNIPSPFYVGMLAPLVAAFGPKFWALRLPAVVSSLLAIAAAYLLGRKVLDRPTAAIAAATLAALPAAVLIAGIGVELTQSPLFGVIALFYAFRARVVATTLAFLACLLAHPTNFFLLPALALVYLGSAWARRPDGPARRRLVVCVAVAACLAAAAMAAYVRGRGIRIGEGVPRDWAVFLGSVARVFDGVSFLNVRGPLPPGSIALHDALFWGLLGVAALGLPRLVADRRWDQLGLIVGLGVGVAGLHVAAGPEVLKTVRYGLVFLAPAAFAFACLIAGLATRPTPTGVAFRPVAVVPLLLVGLLSLEECRTTLVGPYLAENRGSLLRPYAARGVIERSYLRLGQELASSPPASSKRVVVTQDWWTHKPLEYLALARDDLRVVDFERLGGDPEERRRRLVRLMDEGAYALGWSKQQLEQIVRDAYPGDQLRRWEIRVTAGTIVTIHRLDDRPGVLATGRPPATRR